MAMGKELNIFLRKYIMCKHSSCDFYKLSSTTDVPAAGKNNSPGRYAQTEVLVGGWGEWARWGNRFVSFVRVRGGMLGGNEVRT